MLNKNIINKAILSKRPINKLYKNSIGMMLDNYIVSDYICADRISEMKIGGSIAKCPASSFFDKNEYLLQVDVDTELFLKDIDHSVVNKFKSQKIFPHEHILHVFDTFLVVEINPNSNAKEFLAISPKSSKNESNVLGGVLSGGAITELLSIVASNASAMLALHIIVDHLLEYLNTGRGKYRFLGLF